MRLKIIDASGPTARLLAHILILFCTALTTGGCSLTPKDHPQSVEIPAGRTELQLVLNNSAPYVLAHAKGRDFLMHIDTGCPSVVLSEKLATALQAREHPIFPVFIRDGSGNIKWEFSMRRVDELSIGNVSFRGFDVDISNLDRLQGGADDSPLEAIAGLELFQDCLMTIDFPALRLVLEHGELPAENGKALPPAQAAY